MATRCFHNAHHLADRLGAVPGWELPLSAPFFNEFVARTPVPAAEVNHRLADAGLIGGFDLGAVDASLDHSLLLCATELNNRAGIDRFVAAIA